MEQISESNLGAVIVAAGSSRRMGFDKLMAPLDGRPLVSHAIAAFEACEDVGSIVLVCAGERIGEFREISKEFPKVVAVVEGGKERADSVLNGLEALAPKPFFVAIHDGARPLITPEAIVACYRMAIEYGAAVSAEPVTDTLHRVDSHLLATENIPRKNLWRMQTPQIAGYDVLHSLFQEVADRSITDEISLLLRAGNHPRVVENTDWNFKVTYPRDLELAEMVIASRKQTLSKS